jgi:hypothetical protein
VLSLNVVYLAVCHCYYCNDVVSGVRGKYSKTIEQSVEMETGKVRVVETWHMGEVGHRARGTEIYLLYFLNIIVYPVSKQSYEFDQRRNSGHNDRQLIPLRQKVNKC